MSDLAAADGTPWIGVHVLTEFMFCPRAGLLAHEASRDDPGEELDRAPRLDYLPDFTIEELERALEDNWNEIWRMLTWTVPALLLVSIMSATVDWRLALLLVPAGVWLIRWMFDQLMRVADLSRRLKAAHAAASKEPQADSTELQSVNWWELLKAGFTPVAYEDPHEDRSWNLAGRPWRVLHKGSLRIPVFRKRRGKAELYPQHFARIAAYCHLIETAEGGEAPYGIVLFGSEYEGVTVPDVHENRAEFHFALHSARRLIEAAHSAGLMPDLPKPATACHDCPWGRPHVHVPGVTETSLGGKQLPPLRTRGTDKRLYHSECGDRFRWVPPHDRAREKGMC
jgi:hypothetical protein